MKQYRMSVVCDAFAQQSHLSILGGVHGPPEIMIPPGRVGHDLQTCGPLIKFSLSLALARPCSRAFLGPPLWIIPSKALSLSPDMSAGMHAFFQTHTGSDVCKTLGLKEGMLPQGRRTSKRLTRASVLPTTGPSRLSASSSREPPNAHVQH